MAHAKPPTTQDKFRLFVRYTFRTQAAALSHRDVSAIEHLLRKGRRQLETFEDGTVKDVRIALGGVAPKPWRALKAEAALKGKPATTGNFEAAAAAELADAVGLRDNSFKIELARRTIAAVLTELAGVSA